MSNNNMVTSSQGKQKEASLLAFYEGNQTLFCTLGELVATPLMPNDSLKS